MSSRIRSCCTLALLLAIAAPAHAAVYTVGISGAGCSFTTVQAAVAAANANAGADTVRITNTQPYEQQQIVVATAQDLTIAGGYANCTSTAPGTTPGTKFTTLDGSGAGAAPVLNLQPNGSVIACRACTSPAATTCPTAKAVASAWPGEAGWW